MKRGAKIATALLGGCVAAAALAIAVAALAWDMFRDKTDDGKIEHYAGMTEADIRHEAETWYNRFYGDEGHKKSAETYRRNEIERLRRHGYSLQEATTRVEKEIKDESDRNMQALLDDIRADVEDANAKKKKRLFF